MHLHTVAEEYYILRQGQLKFLINGVQVSLQAGEVLMVHPGIPHAIVGGGGFIEHLGIRAPGILDKQEVSPANAREGAQGSPEERVARQSGAIISHWKTQGIGIAGYLVGVRCAIQPVI